MHQKKILTTAQREAITAKYQRRIIELGIPLFGPPDDEELPAPNAKSQELQQRILDATIQLLETEAPPADEEAPRHRKPGDLVRTAERLRAEEVDLPDPSLDREEIAASLEKHAHFERAQVAFGNEMDAVTIEALEGLFPILVALREFVVDVFHVVKEWAEEDPDGPAGEYYQEMKRAWRKGAGRSRGKAGAIPM
jgi:hypothetical protein